MINAHLQNATGTVGILNVGDGDTTLSFDPSKPAERIRAARIVKDMLRRGYCLLVQTGEVDGKKRYARAFDFDEAKCEYIIADFDSQKAQEADQKEQDHGDGQTAAAATRAPTEAPRRGRKAVKAESTRAVSVARIAGG